MRQKTLTYENITSTMLKLCKRLDIVLVLNDPNIPKDNGCAYGNDEIHMGKEYTSNLLFVAILTHEIGHIMISKDRKYRKKGLSVFEEELLAWTKAIEIQRKFFSKKFTKSQGNFMIDCLHTYSKQHYNFSKGYKVDKDDEDDEI